MKASVGFILHENVMCWQEKLKHEHTFSSFLVQHIFHPKASPGCNITFFQSESLHI